MPRYKFRASAADAVSASHARAYIFWFASCFIVDVIAIILLFRSHSKNLHDDDDDDDDDAVAVAAVADCWMLR